MLRNRTTSSTSGAEISPAITACDDPAHQG